MSVSEWGPRNVPTENRQLREVTRFSGVELQTIGARVTSYLNAYSGSSRAQAVFEWAKTENEKRCMQLGLDVLN